MTMVRVDYKLANGERRTLRGWDLRLNEDKAFVMETSVKNPDEEISIVPVTLAPLDQFVEFRVQPCDGSIKEHLAKCAQWGLSDEEIEKLLE